MRRTHLMLLAVALFPLTAAGGEDSLSRLPGYDRYVKVRDAAQLLNSAGRVSGIEWAQDGSSLTFQRQGERFKISLQDFSLEPLGKPERSPQRAVRPSGVGRSQRVPRAQQATEAYSPDGKWVACYRAGNVVLEEAASRAKDGAAEKARDDGAAEKARDGGAAEKARDDGAAEKTRDGGAGSETIQVTTGGGEFYRYGNGCWVYGEELDQDSAMWWSPDSRKLAFYEMDERHLRNYYLTTGNTDTYTGLQVVRYPKAGMENPFVGLLVYDLDTKQTTRIDVGGDRLQYIYHVRFTPDGSELLFNRTNRRQDTLEVVAADPASGRSRVVLTESQATWQENRPLMQFLRDGKRFIWATERTGWKHYELRHLDGRLLHPLSTFGEYPAESVVRVDEDAGYFYYTAYSGDHPLNAQLHRARLDGGEDARMTGAPANHTGLEISPDHKWFVACREAVGEPPRTALLNASGQQVAMLAEADGTKAEELGLVAPELFTFKADDGKTDLHGILYKPARFDPERKYPLVISVYGGPESRGVSNRYSAADAHCEFGFLVATIANRGTTGRGKAFESATYLKLGIVDIQDQADGVRFLCQRPYVDAARVGIFGHSYGGYMSALALVKFPDVFHVGVAGAPVTDWKNYDTIYTERYMRTPRENPDGYRDGSCLTHAKNLRGQLLLLHGLADDNVHPSNTWQLAHALQQAGLRFDMMIYPLSKHGLGQGSSTLRWEYLHRHLRPEPLAE
ncbi:MAG: S9 family peptidase [Planctomycetes bacterium]|nr:S9 family peptidase [Planctomycetota bacterium]